MILEKIREPIFILLYRIIFVLYAEDRSILPIENTIYHDKFSLKWIKNNWILKSTNYSKLNEYEIQNRLKKLFRLIEVGSKELGYKSEEFSMRSYYGRLFDRRLNSQLEKWNIPNQLYIKAIELLTTTKDKKGNRFFLDYAALEIRHLGSIYERLLEFHLTVKDKKIADLPSPKDRKSSGSYYTPQYIVDYIVTNSIGPIVDKIITEIPSKSEQIEKILSLNILDPAMGSGHFLVGATEYLAKRICEIEDKQTSLQDYIERKRDVVRRCIYGVDLNPLAVDLASLSLWLETLSSEKPLSFLSAHLKVGNSLVGCKIEEIFEKQTTFIESEKGRSQFIKNVKDFFMFENLKDDTSNAVKTKTEKYESMLSKGTIYYDLKFLLDSKLSESFGIKVPALGDYRSKVGENSIDFYTYDVGPKIKELSEKHKYFHWELEFPDIFFDEKGNKKPKSGFDVIIGNPPYLNIQGVTANYIQLTEFFKTKYLAATERYDLYVLFIEKATQLLKKEGYLIFILPHKFINSSFGKGIRKFLTENKLLNKLLIFGHNYVFKDSTTYTGILTITNLQNDILRFAEINNLKYSSLEEEIQNLSDNYFESIKINTLTEKPWNLNSGIDANIFLKINKSGPNIMEYFEKILQGIISGDDLIYFLTPRRMKNNTMILYSEKSGKEIEIEIDILRPILIGEDVKKYRNFNRSNYYVIYPYINDNNKQRILKENELMTLFPKTYNYLNSFKNHLINLKKKFKTNPKYWYALHRPRQEVWFEQARIITPQISFGCNMTIDKKKFFHNAKVYSFIKKDSITYNNNYFLAILNSKLVWFYLKKTGDELRGGYFTFTTDYLEPFNIPIPTKEVENDLINKIDQILQIKKEIKNNNATSEIDNKIRKIENEVNRIVYNLYDLNEDEIKVVEDNHPY